MLAAVFDEMVFEELGHVLLPNQWRAVNSWLYDGCWSWCFYLNFEDKLIGDGSVHMGVGLL